MVEGSSCAGFFPNMCGKSNTVSHEKYVMKYPSSMESGWIQKEVFGEHFQVRVTKFRGIWVCTGWFLWCAPERQGKPYRKYVGTFVWVKIPQNMDIYVQHWKMICCYVIWKAGAVFWVFWLFMMVLDLAQHHVSTPPCQMVVVYVVLKLIVDSVLM